MECFTDQSKQIIRSYDQVCMQFSVRAFYKLIHDIRTFREIRGIQSVQGGLEWNKTNFSIHFYFLVCISFCW